MRRKPSAKPINVQLWAGAECTLNRVNDSYLDRFDFNPNGDLVDNLHLLADLGVSAVRFPVLWERVAPEGLNKARWAWPDRGMKRMRELRMRPILGLLHHGSGPKHTHLLDPEFPEHFADYARAVAERYPWVDGYTPINEPLTTARFSGLYGFWHPHAREHHVCVRLLLNQCKATVLAMQAVRSVNPAAYLVQNEDLGKIHSTPALRYQADFHNEFRWLTWDLLCGMIDREHPLWDYLTTNGATEAELDWFRDVQCHPDIIGVDHYVSSERFIDEHTDRYPEHGQNDNGRHTYVDVVAARVLAEGLAGPKTLVREAWDRYHRPLAITEAHNFCTREEQMRWFLEMWDAATELKQEGVDIRAVTAWSVFGAHGWDRLCLEPGGTYEVGVFDTSVSPPRPTAMVPMLKSLAEGRRPDHPLLQIPGWWKRDCRLIHGHSIDSNGNLRLPLQPGDLMVETVYRVAPLLIAGEASLLRDALTDHCDLRGIPYKLADTMEPTTDGIEWTLDNVKPWAVAILPDAPVDRLIAETCAARSLPVTDLSEEQTTGLVTGSISALSPDLTSALNAALDELIDRSLVVLPSIAERAIRAPAAAAH